MQSVNPFASIVITGVVAYPGWVDASIVVAPVITGSGLAREMITGPLPTANEIVSAPGFALASMMASLSVPGPDEFTLVTMNVVAQAEGQSTPKINPSNVRRTRDIVIRFYDGHLGEADQLTPQRARRF